MARITITFAWLLFLILLDLLLSLHAATNQPDVSALQNLYTSMNSAKDLKGWSSNGTDPCGDNWEGITCLDNAVTEIHLSGLHLTGNLGYRLDQLTSLTILDLSNNQLSGGLPYQLPPAVQQLNLGGNNFSGSGGLPYSFMNMTHLTSLNMSNNQLSGSISNVFWHSHNLLTIDLSFNNFTGQLPQSFSNLSVLSVMYLQNNALSGDVNVLANLPLQDLNLENNQFTGWLPSTLDSIPDLKLNGNNLKTGPAPPPPFVPSPPGLDSDDTTSSPPGLDSNNRTNSNGSAGDLDQLSSPISSPRNPTGSRLSLSPGAVAGIAIAGVMTISIVALIIIMLCLKPQEQLQRKEIGQPVGSIVMQSSAISPVRVSTFAENLEVHLQEATLKPQVADLHKRQNTEELGRKSSRNKVRTTLAATKLSMADLQVATDSFSEGNIMGEGTYGVVYKANLQNQVVAVKKLDTLSPHFDDDVNITELISSISGLHHPNITQLVGYCVEHGQCLLVYNYFEMGTLHDILHPNHDTRVKLTWNARIKIALGAARALEYLHEVCLPPVVHMNFKSANILLDEDLNSHLSDCGIASFMQCSERQVSTRITGSCSYSAPEHALSGEYTIKTDIYGFGVVMLELLTGRIPYDSTKPQNEKSLIRWATPQLHDIDALKSMVDTALEGQYPVRSVSRFADIISSCLQPEPEFRPLMSEVVQSLVRLVRRASLAK